MEKERGRERVRERERDLFLTMWYQFSIMNEPLIDLIKSSLPPKPPKVANVIIQMTKIKLLHMMG